MTIDKEMCLKKGLKAKNIAELTGLSIKTIEKAFNGGSISSDTYQKIRKVFADVIEEYNLS